MKHLVCVAVCALAVGFVRADAYVAIEQSVAASDAALDAAQAAFTPIAAALKERGIYLAAQCCEHLNRALVVERALAESRGLEIVSVVPQPKAGGSFATAAWKQFKEPVAVEFVRAQAGLDIGGTLIGMHLKHVAVPVRLPMKQIGEAILLAARVRPKFVGGGRAVYNETLL